ncbi:hypothetical protein YC2023_005020 [Brassica napus]
MRNLLGHLSMELVMRGLRVEWIFITSVSLSSLSSVDSQNVFLRCRCCVIRRTDCFCRRSKVADEVAVDLHHRYCNFCSSEGSLT